MHGASNSRMSSNQTEQIYLAFYPCGLITPVPLYPFWLRSSLLWLSTVHSMALLRATCPNNFVTLLTCQPEPIFGHRLPVFLMFAHLAALLLVTAHLLHLVPGSGTLSLAMLLLQHRCCHFVENWRHTYFGSHILTLLCDLRHSGPCSFFLLWPL